MNRVIVIKNIFRRGEQDYKKNPKKNFDPAEGRVKILRFLAFCRKAKNPQDFFPLIWEKFFVSIPAIQNLPLNLEF